VEPHQLIETLTTAGFSESQANVLVGVIWDLGQTPRAFNFQTPFAATDPACVPTFARTFSHVDWIDGESVVQAEETTREEGFNVRFHNIEHDLDALAADTAKAFVCLAAMRQSLRAMMDEVKAELNRINTDLFACCQDQTTRPPLHDFHIVHDFHPIHDIHDIVIDHGLHEVGHDIHAIDHEVHGVGHEIHGVDHEIHGIDHEVHGIAHDVGHEVHDIGGGGIHNLHGV
jgi:hypothetical protein